MGKNFSRNNSKGLRRKSDFYETPYSITKHLLDRESFDFSKSCLEPACGQGAIVKVLEPHWKTSLTHYDKEVDFLTETKPYHYVITNPPFSLAIEFVLHAKTICKHKICMLLPLSYLHGKKRHDNIYMDKDFPLKSVYVFTRYPMLGDPLREDGKYRTGMMVYAWYVWETEYKGEPVIKWIDNNNDVLTSKEIKCGSSQKT